MNRMTEVHGGQRMVKVHSGKEIFPKASTP